MYVESMAERRPPLVSQLCNDQFLQARQDPGGGKGYRFLGDQTEYKWGVLSSRQLLKMDGKSVLDVGCGYGDIVDTYAKRNSRNRAVGVTAYAYTASENVISADVHNLRSRLEEHGQTAPFQVTMSRWLMCHLVDPVGALEQMANSVDMGGVLITDTIRLRGGTQAVARACMDGLVTSGHYTVMGAAPKLLHNSEGATITNLYLRRQSPADEPVRLPVGYEVGPLATWHYSLA